MAINWFPGHMNKAKREIRKGMRGVDLVFEVLDARLPDSSENPLVANLREHRPCIKLLNKQDLADREVTEAWLAWLRRKPGVHAMAHDRGMVSQAHSLVELSRRLLPADRNKDRPVVAMIVGVPNVGKSTLINTMAGRGIAKTSNKPAVTKRQQRIPIGNNFILLDTPGFLWPKLDPPACGYRLAISGAVADTAVDYLDMAHFAAGWLAKDYPQAVAARYKLDEVPTEPMALLEAIARKRGCLRKGGIIDLDKVSALLIRELRQGALGRLSMERPPVRAAAEPEAE